MRRIALLALLAACGSDEPAGVPDAAIKPDAAPPLPCPPDADLLFCLSFDGPTPVNEGAAQVSLLAQNVTRVEHELGGAGHVDTSTLLFIEPTEALTGMLSVEMWFKLDSEPTDLTRYGLFDANTSFGPSLFFYNDGETARHYRFYSAGPVNGEYFAAPLDDRWYYVVIVCDAGIARFYIDGIQVMENPSCETGTIADGFSLGANNNRPNVPMVNDSMLGSLDDIRIWKRVLREPFICARSGRPDC